MNKPLVLIVEDEPTHRRLCELLVDKYGFSSFSVGHPTEALDAFGSTDAFAVVLMDWRLPDMDGIECMKQMRSIDESRNKRTPIIAVTAAAMVTDRESFLKAGMDDYLSKPFRAEELERLLKKHISPLQTYDGGLLQSASRALKAGDTANANVQFLQIVGLIQHICGPDKALFTRLLQAMSQSLRDLKMPDEAQVLERYTSIVG